MSAHLDARFGVLGYPGFRPSYEDAIRHAESRACNELAGARRAFNLAMRGLAGASRARAPLPLGLLREPIERRSRVGEAMRRLNAARRALIAAEHAYDEAADALAALNDTALPLAAE